MDRMSSMAEKLSAFQARLSSTQIGAVAHVFANNEILAHLVYYGANRYLRRTKD